METLGLEVRRGYTVAAFAERGHRPVVVGDGRRTVIPNAVYRGAWGSAAAEHADAIWPDESATRGLSGPHAAAFWEGLRARLRHFLGIGDRTLSAVPVVVAFDGDTGEAAELRASLAAAGFTDVTLVPPPHAAAHALPPVGTPDTVHRVVCVGDRSAEVGCFRLRMTAAPVSPPQTLTGVGSAYWIRSLTRELDAVRSAERGWDRLRLWQSMLELAAALDRNTPDRRRVWAGAHADELVTDVEFRSNCLERTIEHAQLVTWLEGTAEGTAAEHMWAAGLGGVFPIRWPAGVTLMPDPAHAVAIGASLFGHRPVPPPALPARTTVESRSPPPRLPPAPPAAPVADAPWPVLFPVAMPVGEPQVHHDHHRPDAPKLPDLPPDWDRLIGGSE